MSKKATIQVEKKDGGYYFPAVDIHVVAKNEKAALKLIQETHGIDVEAVTKAQQEAEKAQEG